MNPDPETIARMSRERDAARQTCIMALQPAVQRLKDEGHQPADIVRALAFLSVAVLSDSPPDEQETQLYRL